MSSRGVVVLPPMHIHDGGVTIDRSDIPASDFRRYALFWDRIDWPDNNLVSLGGGGPDVDLLTQEGILSRTRVQFASWSGNVGHAFGLMQVKVFEERSRAEPGGWSIAQGQPELYLPTELTSPKRTIEVELYQSLPVPDESVPLADVLEFKRKREAELKQFRGAMDDLYLEVANAADIPRAKTRAIERVETSVLALEKIMTESKLKRIMSTMKIELNLTDVLKDAVIGGATSSAFGLSPVLATSLGVVTSALKFGFSIIPKTREIPANLRDYAYVAAANRELGR